MVSRPSRTVIVDSGASFHIASVRDVLKKITTIRPLSYAQPLTTASGLIVVTKQVYISVKELHGERITSLIAEDSPPLLS